MLSSGEIAKIRPEIKKLENARDKCNDGGIRKQIEGWIENEKKKLGSVLI